MQPDEEEQVCEPRAGARNELRPGGEARGESKQKHMWPCGVGLADTGTATKTELDVKQNLRLNIQRNQEMQKLNKTQKQWVLNPVIMRLSSNFYLFILFFSNVFFSLLLADVVFHYIF